MQTKPKPALSRTTICSKDVGDSDADGVNDRFKIATYDANGTIKRVIECVSC